MKNGGKNKSVAFIILFCVFTLTVNSAGLSQAEKICSHPVWEELMEGRTKIYKETDSVREREFRSPTHSCLVCFHLQLPAEKQEAAGPGPRAAQQVA